MILFLGAIDYIMQLSGMKEILSLIYAPGSIDEMFNGHAYARAVRAHTILQLTSAIIILNELVIDDVMAANLITTTKNKIHNTFPYNDFEDDNETSGALPNRFNERLREYEKRGPT